MNLKQIANLAGVSTATVSRVINGDPKVRERTRRHVEKVIEENGYVQNIFAHNLRRSRSSDIGFLISNFSNPFFIDVYSGFEPVCRKQGFNVVIGNTNEDVDQEIDAIEHMLSYKVSGIVASFVGPSQKTLEKIKKNGVHILQLDRWVKNLSSDSVVIDNVSGAIGQVDYLAGLGHRRIALIKGTDFDSNGIERLQGFYMGMEKNGLPVQKDYLVAGDFIEENAYQATIKLLSCKVRPTAIIAHNNLMCIGAYRALRDMNISIPQEISLIGFDNFSFSEHLQPTITLIDRPEKEMGELAAKMILERISGEYTGEARKIVFPVKLKIGGSCSKPYTAE